MKAFLQGVAGATVAAILFSTGFAIGKVQWQRPETSDVGPRLLRIELAGIPSPQVDCLRYVSSTFDKPTAGLLSLVCNGSSGLR